MTEVAKLSRLSTEEALDLLIQRRDTIKSFPTSLRTDVSSGSVYLFYVPPTENDTHDFKVDFYKWLNRNSKDIKIIRNETIYLIQRKYYSINLNSIFKTNPDFKKECDNLQLFSKITYYCPQLNGACVFYYGNEKTRLISCHGNAKLPETKLSHFHQILPSTRTTTEELCKTELSSAKIYQEVDKQIQKLTDDIIQTESEPKGETFYRLAAPRNPYFVEYLKKKTNEKFCYDKDTLYSCFYLAQTVFSQQVIRFSLFPDFFIIISDPEALRYGKSLLKNKWVNQLVSYDTTFELCNAYVSILLIRNHQFFSREYKINPYFPVLFCIHDAKNEETHTSIWKEVKRHLDIDEHIPISTDREKSITNAIISQGYESNLVFCSNHIKQNVDRYLKGIL